MKIFQIKTRGNSMFPILQDGDTIEYIQAPFSTIKLNDIVLIFEKDTFITHRVIYKTKTTCITRGDNNTKADTTVQKGKVLAKVIRLQRRGKWCDIQDVYRVQSALYLHEIQKLETVLTLYKIPHVFLKGVLVSLRYEGTIPKRIYADCDILVQRNDEKNIHNIFQKLGYKLQERLLWQPQRLPSRQTNKPEVSYVKEVQGIPVVFDVHFEPVFLMTKLGGMNMLYPSALLEKFRDKIIKDVERKKVKGYTYSLCSPVDQILYLALHIFHHNFTDSMRYQLLDNVIRKSGSASIWKELSTIVKDYRLEGYVYGVFLLLKKYYKTPIPNSFFASIRPSNFKLQVILRLCSGQASYIFKHVDIFSHENRTKAGISRFLLIFLLSPNPWWKKIALFFHPQIIETVWKLGVVKLKTR